MFKSIAIISSVATLGFGAPVLAGPYANIESNALSVGTEYEGSVIETHLGYEAELGESTSWYLQGGPALVFPNGDDASTELSGKIGIQTSFTEKLSGYAEVAAITGGEIDFDEAITTNVKTGLKFNF